MIILRDSRQKGFTLVEMLMAIFIFTLLGLGVIALIEEIFTSSNQQSLFLNNIDQARIVSSKFIDELRNTTFGKDGSYPLNQAGDSQIIFYSSVGGNDMIVDRIRYYFSGNTLYKGIIVPTGSPLNYNLSSEIVTSVQTNLDNGITPVFYYYDGNYNGDTASLNQPINVNQVKFVKINLIFLNQNETNKNVISSINAGATIRNLKNNLGN